MKKSGKTKKILFAVVILILASAGAYYYISGKKPNFSFETVDPQTREITVNIDATGTVEPEDLVEVTARVSGEIMSFGKDIDGNTIDYGSRVKKGDLLALIDDEIPKSNLTESSAQLKQKESSLAQAQANLVLSQAKFNQAKRDWTRAEKLGKGEALSQASYDEYLSQYEITMADVEVSKAAIKQAEAAIEGAKADLKIQQRNLEYCLITSPVDGVIIDRVVDIGQTVVSNMSASSLFLIAKDLSRMQVWASVNEADIGNIRKGQKVSFTVDAFPGETFYGEVEKIRLNATMSQNVVTYIVEVTTDNSSGRLLPYLTANLKFEVEKIKDAVCVPVSALRLIVDDKYISAAASEEAILASAKVWTPAADGLAMPIPVNVLVSDGEYVAVENLDGSKFSLPVITAIEELKSDSGKAVNPFMPKPRARKKK